jgi:hypothetical protein
LSDQEKSKDFYVRILRGKLIKQDNPCYIKLVNTWIILNSGGGPTPDKPEALLEAPSDLNRVNGFLNLRFADIWACSAANEEGGSTPARHAARGCSQSDCGDREKSPRGKVGFSYFFSFSVCSSFFTAAMVRAV